MPNIIQLVLFEFIFLTTDTYVFHGHEPLLESAMGFLVMGVVMYLFWARGKGLWPFSDADFDATFEDEMDQLIVFHDDYKQELAALTRKVIFCIFLFSNTKNHHFHFYLDQNFFFDFHLTT